MDKNCAIFCASSMDKNKRYVQRIKDLMKVLSHSHNILYGGSNTGYMKLVADSVIENNGYLIGIMPRFLQSKELKYEACHEWIETENMNTRKELLVEKADCIIALPGGVGTLEEVIDVLSWTHIGLINKPIVLYNLDGFFDGLVSQIQRGIDDEMIQPSLMNRFMCSDDIDSIVDFISSTNQELWDIYDKDRKVSAKVIERSKYSLLGENEYHMVVYVNFRKGKQVLLQKRAAQKTRGSTWDLTGGSVLAFETSLLAAIREVKEELGLELNPSDLRLSHQVTTEHTHFDIYEVLVDDHFDLNQLTLDFEEVSDVDFFDEQKVRDYRENGQILWSDWKMQVCFDDKILV